MKSVLVGDSLKKVKYSEKIPRNKFLPAGKFPIISQEKDLINGYWNNEESVFKIEKPVVIFGDHTKNLKFIDFDFVLGADGVKILSPSDEINPRYFYYALQNINLEDLGYARHFRVLKEHTINYPKSINEQKKIVRRLDEVFEKIEKAKENTGKSLKNTQELFSSELFSLISQSEGEEVTLDTFLKLNYGKALPKNDRSPYGAFNVYGANGVKDKANKFLWEGPSIIIGRKGSAGEVNLTEGPFWPLDVTYYVEHDSSQTNLEFLFYLLKTLNLPSLAKGVKPGINRNDVYSIIVKLPYLKEQEYIVTKLKELSEKTQKLQKLYQQKLDNLKELKQSILSQAFSGKL